MNKLEETIGKNDYEKENKEVCCSVNDMINHPPHYESGKYECINVMGEVFGTVSLKSFCLCNAFKYLYRCMHKHNSPVEDIEKSVWYLKKYLELEKEENDH